MSLGHSVFIPYINDFNSLIWSHSQLGTVEYSLIVETNFTALANSPKQGKGKY